MYPQYEKRPSEKYRKFFNGTGITLNSIEAYFNDRLNELQEMSCRGDAWFFGSCCILIEVLTWGACFTEIEDRNTAGITAADFKKFIDDHFVEANPSYKEVEKNLKKLNVGHKRTNSIVADRLYETLRCGVVHSFSMKQKLNVDGYDILLAHYHDFDDMTNHHLQVVELDLDGKKRYSIILVAEEFVHDLRRAAEHLIAEAKTTSVHEENLIKLFNKKPPLGFLEISPK